MTTPVRPSDVLRAEERGDRATQRRTGRAVAGISAVGAVLLPASPFWVLLALGLTAVRRAAVTDGGDRLTRLR